MYFFYSQVYFFVLSFLFSTFFYSWSFLRFFIFSTETSIQYMLYKSVSLIYLFCLGGWWGGSVEFDDRVSLLRLGRIEIILRCIKTIERTAGEKRMLCCGAGFEMVNNCHFRNYGFGLVNRSIERMAGKKRMLCRGGVGMNGIIDTLRVAVCVLVGLVGWGEVLGGHSAGGESYGEESRFSVFSS